MERPADPDDDTCGDALLELDKGVFLVLHQTGERDDHGPGMIAGASVARHTQGHRQDDSRAWLESHRARGHLTDLQPRTNLFALCGLGREAEKAVASGDRVDRVDIKHLRAGREVPDGNVVLNVAAR